MSRENDFTYKGYQELLVAAKENHIPRDYTNLKRDEPFILIRHDIDVDIDNSAVLASMENYEGIVATYFVLLRGHYYNPFEKRTHDTLQYIIEQGHKVGLHFDCHFYQAAGKAQMEQRLNDERETLSSALGVEIDVFSFHDPTPDVMAMEDDSYADMVNTYSAYFKNEVAYSSDSNGYWRHDPIVKVIRENPNTGVQALTHPLWWQAEAIPPQTRIQVFIDSEAQRRKDEYDAALAESDRENRST